MKRIVELEIELVQDLYVNNGKVELGLRKDPYINPKLITLNEKYYEINDYKLTIKIDDIIRDGTLVNCSYAFSRSNNITEITNLEQLDTRHVTNMGGMFSGCYRLKQLNMSNWNTSKVFSMSYMFRGCRSLEQVDVSNFDTSNVTDMSHMFQECKSLKIIDTSNWNTSKVISTSIMFSDCRSLEHIDVSKWNTSNVTNMSHVWSL